ncbi:hypothetical protein D3C76_614280 [compost metagenome]
MDSPSRELPRGVYQCRILIELSLELFITRNLSVNFFRRRHRCLTHHAGFNILQHLTLMRLVAVQLQAELTQTGTIQTTLDDLQGRHFLCYEQHLLAIEQGRSNQVGNRL